MFWSWIRQLISSNSFVQQFTNHYRTPTDNENTQPTSESDSHSSTAASKHVKTNTSMNANNKLQKANQNISSRINNNNNKNSDSTVSLNLSTGNGNRNKQEDDAIKKREHKSMNNQFDSESGAYLDNLRKLLNLNAEQDGHLLLGSRTNQARLSNEPNFYQIWLAEYRNMQLKGKQKLASKVDQVKESLNQFRETSASARKEELDRLNKRQLNQFRTPIISLPNDSIKEANNHTVDSSKLISKNIDLIDLNEPQSLATRTSQFVNVRPIFNPTDFQFSQPNQDGKLSLCINSELMNQIKVSQAQSYHQQLNVSAGSVTPTVCGNFRAQVKRSSYPSGLRTTALRIGPRLNRDKSRSRFESFCLFVYLFVCVCIF